MKIDYLPTEGEKDWAVYAFYDENSNQVIWNGVTLNGLGSYQDHVLGTKYAQFMVFRRGNIVIVEACGWYSSDFHYRFELTEQPDRVVILAAHAAALYDQAHDEESPARG